MCLGVGSPASYDLTSNLQFRCVETILREKKRLCVNAEPKEYVYV